MSEKTEKASAYKLKKAKEKGQVSKSVELNSCILLLVLLGLATALWPFCLKKCQALMNHLFSLASTMTLSVDTVNRLFQFIYSTLIALWLPFAFTTLITIVLSTWAQTGFVWALPALSPDLKRLNIIQGVKRLFTSKLLFEAAKNSLKLFLSFVLLAFFLRQNFANFLMLLKTTPYEHPALIMHLLLKLLLQLLLLLIALAAIDKLYTRWKYNKDNRMSKQEVKDEYRQREGDPKIKAKMRQLQQQLRQKTASLEQVKTADVIVTNPTHLAIALKYERGTMPAPKVVCKAQGDLAKQVRTLAQRYSIPLIENKPFARALFAAVDLNQWIHREHFPIAAMIFREIYKQKEFQAC